MKPYEFIGLLGIATTVVGIITTIVNDHLAGVGLITAGMSDISLAVVLAQGTAPAS